MNYRKNRGTAPRRKRPVTAAAIFLLLALPFSLWGESRTEGAEEKSAVITIEYLPTLLPLFFEGAGIGAGLERGLFGSWTIGAVLAAGGVPAGGEEGGAILFAAGEVQGQFFPFSADYRGFLMKAGLCLSYLNALEESRYSRLEARYWLPQVRCAVGWRFLLPLPGAAALVVQPEAGYSLLLSGLMTTSEQGNAHWRFTGLYLGFFSPGVVFGVRLP